MKRVQDNSGQGSGAAAANSCGKALGKDVSVQAPLYGQRTVVDDGAELGQTSTMTSSGAVGLMKRSLHRRSSMETTVTSSCGAESSGVRGKEGAPPADGGKGKRSREEEAADDQSEVRGRGDEESPLQVLKIVVSSDGIFFTL